MEVQTAIDRALSDAVRDPTGAARALLIELFDGKRIANSLGEALGAIAERVTAIRMGNAPASGKPAEPLGDGWYQCPHCEEVFEGEAARCNGCSKPLGVTRPALELVLDGATIWLVASGGDRRSPVHKLDWMRVDAAPRWFELLDETGRTAAAASLMAKLVVPPNLNVVGTRDGGRTMLVHESKFAVHVADADGVRALPEQRSATELVVDQLSHVLYPEESPRAPSGKAIASKGHARNPDLEAALVADPDRVEAYLVYADWLQAKGDPRGELIVLDHAGKTVEATRLRDREAAHFFGAVARSRHQLEPSGTPLGRHTSWRWGFLDALWISNERSGEVIDVPEALAALLDHPSCLVLRALTIGIVDYEVNGYDEVAQVIGARSLPTLHSLTIGDFHSEETELNWSDAGKLSPIYQAVPDLRSLTIRSGSMELGRIALPKLESLTVISGGLDKGSFAEIGVANWPNLTRLSVQLGNAFSYTADDVAQLLDATKRPKLMHLGLGNSVRTDDLATMIAASEIAPQLVSLDFSESTFGDAGARALVAGSFPRLEHIDVTNCYLTEDGLATLATIAKTVESGEQRDDDGTDRYIGAYE